ncbi:MULTISPECIES: DUF3616 domain-containing protein [unclassified Coleofasciculus]|uniref:DUF3616 domain-containing protein n=1 Tax=unclassified Coleofasciculus TaxID=2692782 RepID=UPI001880FDF5|nr:MULTISPECIES: DUF3616 domain-containing protein [unclassified Coleofasciculus]MBE9125961.1 DUF3616 domain-containing protein [Coleofasciculus sp. LEGE 07081]MBE9148843.1 DUF3616 domain-containing protein [Coleofasciculus sp. LEGE 07092]
MTNPFLLTRVLLRFNDNDKTDDFLEDLSAAAFTPDGSLWVGSDELLGIERLSLIEPYVFGAHQSFFLGDFVELFNQDDEIDIEGMDYADSYLWVTGSHSTKRGKAKGKKPQKDIKRLAKIKTDANRYLLARIPVLGGELMKSYSHPDNPDERLTAACLQKTETTNILIEALKEDSHLGPFVTFPLPSKDNGFDIEGLAVRGDRVFLGFRGPVLRGWAVIVEIEVAETEPGILTLKEIGENGSLYKKHFVNLQGLGVRELCWHGDDLLILAGPTMELEGAMRLFRHKNLLDCSGDSLGSIESGDLEVLFDLPITPGRDRAEGLALFPCLGQSNCLLVVYDSPAPARKVGSDGVYVDVFRL